MECLTLKFFCRRTCSIKSPFVRYPTCALLCLIALFLFYWITVGVGYFWFALVWKIDYYTGCYPDEILQFKAENIANSILWKCGDPDIKKNMRCSSHSNQVSSNHSFYFNCSMTGFFLLIPLAFSLMVIGLIGGCFYIYSKEIINTCIDNYKKSKSDAQHALNENEETLINVNEDI